MEWQQFSVVASDRDTESVAEALLALGASSVTFQDAADEPVYEPPPDSHPLWSKTRVIALFENALSLEEIRDNLSKTLSPDTLTDWTSEMLPERVWEREWMDHFQPMRFGDRLWVCPSYRAPPDPSAVNLLLDPGLAFGTGTHPSTALCLEALAALDLQNRQVMDYGCGSGILAIAAILLGARQALAVDIDPQALTATASNAENNRVADRIRCVSPDQVAQETADLVIANILAKPLEELAPLLGDYVKPGGKLILAGLLVEQIEMVRRAYEPKFHFAEPTIRENWVRLDACKTV
ncbi:MAG: 50S ribosomal protein L11 methyltransferase [Gammaproteobacteria bacterium]